MVVIQFSKRVKLTLQFTCPIIIFSTALVLLMNDDEPEAYFGWAGGIAITASV